MKTIGRTTDNARFIAELTSEEVETLLKLTLVLQNKRPYYANINDATEYDLAPALKAIQHFVDIKDGLNDLLHTVELLNKSLMNNKPEDIRLQEFFKDV